MYSLKKILVLVVLASGCFTATFAQSDIPYTNLKLDDMSNFKPQAGNWQIVGNVLMDRNIDVHAKSKKPAIQTKPGSGILVNVNEEKKKDNLLTNWEHGDIELELEVMLPKGSNSGIYLQGRYEVQLFDSWGVKNPSFSDIGGIYRNWENAPGKIYMGKTPLSNPAKAPGLWQTMKISFKAPRFNASGEKIANARFVKVILNDVVIHENLEVPLPTGGPVENNEKPLGPLMIQGDHGGVAFRNIKFRTFKPEKATLSNIQYSYYEGKFPKIADFVSGKPVKSGSTKELTWEVGTSPDLFGYTFNGNINIPDQGAYVFSMQANGGGKLLVDGETVIDYEGMHDRNQVQSGKINLTAGPHAFVLFYYKSINWLPPTLGLFVEGTSLEKHSLQAFNSFPPESNPTNPIIPAVGSEPKILRAFLDFKGKRRTHTIAVGDPLQIHYILDLKSGTMLEVWKGAFVDATPMWHERGDGSFSPLGSVLQLSGDPQLAVLSDKNAAFPTEMKESDFRGKGYDIDPNGRPVFNYIFNGIKVEDKIYPEENGNILTRELKISSSPTPGIYFKVAEGKDIILLSDGSFAVDDSRFYIKVLSVSKPFIRDSNGKKELLIPVENQTPVKYSIIW